MKIVSTADAELSANALRAVAERLSLKGKDDVSERLRKVADALATPGTIHVGDIAGTA